MYHILTVKKIKQLSAHITPDQKTLLKNWEKYRGSIVMVVGDKLFATKQAKNVDNLIQKIESKFHRRPLITYIPKEGTMVLFT